MFEYTRASIKVTLEALNRYAKIFKYGSLIFTSAYFGYALYTDTGIFILNAVLASLFVIYTLFDLITARINNIHTAKKIIKRSYGWVSLMLKLVSLGAMVYGIYSAATNVTAISTILATLMIILWVLQAFLELIIAVIEDKYDLILAGWKQDVDNIMKPKTKIDNFFKKMKGEPIPLPPEKSREIIILEKKIKEMELAKKLKQDKNKKASVTTSKVKKSSITEESKKPKKSKIK